MVIDKIENVSHFADEMDQPGPSAPVLAQPLHFVWSRIATQKSYCRLIHLCPDSTRLSLYLLFNSNHGIILELHQGYFCLTYIETSSWTEAILRLTNFEASQELFMLSLPWAESHGLNPVLLQPISFGGFRHQRRGDILKP